MREDLRRRMLAFGLGSLVSALMIWGTEATIFGALFWPWLVASFAASIITAKLTPGRNRALYAALYCVLLVIVPAIADTQTASRFDVSTVAIYHPVVAISVVVLFCWRPSSTPAFRGRTRKSSIPSDDCTDLRLRRKPRSVELVGCPSPAPRF